MVLNTKKKTKKIFICDPCERKFDRNTRLDVHLIKCKSKQFKQMEEIVKKLKEENLKLKEENLKLREIYTPI